MKHNVKVSVLIPVYGVEKYIERCARSLFEQTMKEGIEFIFTNDCTKDKSIEILKQVLAEYPNRKSQVKIINHDTNQGLAVARITGVKAAMGEYVIHCDSDDWMEPNMYELMYAKAKETDAQIVICDYINEYGKYSKYITQELPDNKSDLIYEILSSGRLHGFFWNRLIKSDFYNFEKFKSPQNVSMYEDMVVTVNMHRKCNSVALLNTGLYHYNRSNDTSISHRYTEKQIESAITAFSLLEDQLSDFSRCKAQAQKMKCYFSDLFINNHEHYNPSYWRMKYDNPNDDYLLNVNQRFSRFLCRHKLYYLQLFHIKMINLICCI